jgi:uncharacterized membrane protein YidH (DUF202 family)
VAVAVDDSARLRDLLASRRTLLAYIRTALSFAGLGFAVAKFGLSPKMTHVAVLLGTLMVLVGLMFAIAGLAQHRAVVLEIEPRPPASPRPSSSFHLAAGIGSALVCVLLAIYLLASTA